MTLIQNGASMGLNQAAQDFVYTEQGGPTLTDASGRVYAPAAPPMPATPVVVSGTAAAAAINAQALPAVAAKTNWLRGFIISTANPAAAVTGVATVTGLLAGTISIDVVEAVATGLFLTVTFPDPLPASAVNSAITVTLPAIASGAVSAVTVFGFVR